MCKAASLCSSFKSSNSISGHVSSAAALSDSCSIRFLRFAAAACVPFGSAGFTFFFLGFGFTHVSQKEVSLILLASSRPATSTASSKLCSCTISKILRPNLVNVLGPTPDSTLSWSRLLGRLMVISSRSLLFIIWYRGFCSSSAVRLRQDFSSWYRLVCPENNRELMGLALNRPLACSKQCTVAIVAMRTRSARYVDIKNLTRGSRSYSCTSERTCIFSRNVHASSAP
mmetsp:Transcript_16852/g.37417  ORF Transcript_16852/g.37417 Transcript_16852/m.37417 type:complete len:228 (-) Transcript_16852:108-791(-)